MPDIDVAMTTWPNHPCRLEYFQRTWESIEKYVTASRHSMRFVCSAETERDPMFAWMGDELEAFCKQAGIELHWHDAPPNLGANLNAAIRLCDAPIVLVQQDDWCWDCPVDLSPGVDFILANPAVDIIRYSWPDNDRMRPTFQPQPDGWRRIALGSTWLYGDDPHLRRRDFMDRWGWYLEGSYHSSASKALLTKLRQGRADIRVADRCYCHHFGSTSSYPRDQEQRAGRKR